MGISLPDFETEPRYLFQDSTLGVPAPAQSSGFVRAPHHIAGASLQLTGHMGERDGSAPRGLVGKDITEDVARSAAHDAAVNALGGIKFALGGDWDRLVSLMRLIIFVACVPEYTDVHTPATGATELFNEVLGTDRGLIGQAALGFPVLEDNHCVILWLDAEIRDDHRVGNR
jgi:hypothetical protein